MYIYLFISAHSREHIHTTYIGISFCSLLNILRVVEERNMQKFAARACVPLVTSANLLLAHRSIQNTDVFSILYKTFFLLAYIYLGETLL